LSSCAARFVAAARDSRRRACFFAVEPRFLESGPFASMPIGEQPSWDPSAWDAVLRKDRRLREQLRRARAKGVVVRALEGAELAKEGSERARIEQLVGRWLESRKIAP